MRSPIITFRLPRPLVAAVDLKAERERRSRSQMIVVLIEQALQQSSTSIEPTAR